MAPKTGFAPVAVVVNRPLHFLTCATLEEGRESVLVNPGRYQIERIKTMDGKNGPSWIRLLEPVDGKALGMSEECLVTYARDKGDKRWRAPECQGPIIEIIWK